MSWKAGWLWSSFALSTSGVSALSVSASLEDGVALGGATTGTFVTLTRSMAVTTGRRKEKVLPEP
jgi:hypothetical protein